MLSGGIIKYYLPFQDTRVETNASNGVVAGVLNQLQDDGTWKPVAFFLKIMSPKEMRYKIYNKEMLAVIRGL